MERVPRHVHIIHTVVRLIGGFFIGFGIIVGLVEAGVISGIVPPHLAGIYVRTWDMVSCSPRSRILNTQYGSC